MNSWLGLAATKGKTYLKTAGACVAASTLTAVSFLQDDGDKPSFFEAIGRIFDALGEVLTHWPAGKPINGLTLILEVFKVADLIDVGAKVDAFFLKTLDIPRLVITSKPFLWILGIAMAPMIIFAVLNIIRYSSAYRRETRTRRGEDRVHAGRSRVLPTGTWFVTRLLPWLVIGPGFIFLSAYAFSLAWNGMLSILEIFYKGTSTTIGGVWVTILEGMVSGSVAQIAAQFILMFLVVIAGCIFLAVLILQRVILYIVANPKFEWDATKILRGLRDVTLAKPGRKFLEKFFSLALTVFLVGLLAWLTAWLSTIFTDWPIAFFFVVFLGVIWWGPKELVTKYAQEEFYEGVGEWWEDFFSPTRGIETPEEAEAREAQEERYAGVTGKVRRGWDRQHPATKAYFKGQAKAGEVALKTLRPKEYAMAKQALNVIDQVRSSEEPQAASFDEIYKRRATLDTDPATSHAMLAWLKDQYTLGTPAKPHEEMIADARRQVERIRSRKPKVFESMAERGEDL
jgi:hypothetical protein